MALGVGDSLDSRSRQAGSSLSSWPGFLNGLLETETGTQGTGASFYSCREEVFTAGADLAWQPHGLGGQRAVAFGAELCLDCAGAARPGSGDGRGLGEASRA